MDSTSVVRAVGQLEGRLGGIETAIRESSEEQRERADLAHEERLRVLDQIEKNRIEAKNDVRSAIVEFKSEIGLAIAEIAIQSGRIDKLETDGKRIAVMAGTAATIFGGMMTVIWALLQAADKIWGLVSKLFTGGTGTPHH